MLRAAGDPAAVLAGYYQLRFKAVRIKKSEIRVKKAKRVTRCFGD